jgi:uncharacterized iron-regulated protein
MKKIVFILSVVFFIFEVCFLTEINAGEIRIFRVSDRKTISYGQMIEDIRKAKLIFVGETHDNKMHHRFQLDVIKGLHDLKIPIAVGLEMFTADNQAILDRWTAGTISEDNFIQAYYANWNFPWPLYGDIFLYAKDNRIPLIGLNVSPEIAQKVAQSGFSFLTKEEREKLPPETGCVVDKEYMEFIRRAYAMHGHRDKQFLYFCEAQLLWDQVMARNLLEFLRKNPDKTVVVLTGNGHAWKRGIPEQVRTLSEKTHYRVLLPFVSGYIGPSEIAYEDADYILLP